MNLSLDDVELQIAASARRFCSAEWNRDRLRDLVDRGVRPGPDTWKAAADQGWFSLRRPEHDGGAGLAMGAAAVLFLEVGRALVPGPVLWTHLAATLLDGDAGDAGTGAADGSRVVSGLDARSAGPWYVADLDLADDVLVFRDEALELLPVAELEAEPRPALDPTATVWEVGRLPRGRTVGDRAVAARALAEGTCLTAAEAAGGARAVTDLAVAYAREREQFGQPIGAFQAVKHLCVDMAVEAHAAESAVLWAAVHLDERRAAEGTAKAGMAEVVAGSAFLANSRRLIQVLGAMGYTWEHDAHLFLKRAHALDRRFDDHRAGAAGIGRALCGTAPGASHR